MPPFPSNRAPHGPSLGCVRHQSTWPLRRPRWPWVVDSGWLELFQRRLCNRPVYRAVRRVATLLHVSSIQEYRVLFLNVRGIDQHDVAQVCSGVRGKDRAAETHRGREWDNAAVIDVRMAEATLRSRASDRTAILVLYSMVLARRPWNIPHSSRTWCPLTSRRYFEPVVVRSAPKKVSFMMRNLASPRTRGDEKSFARKPRASGGYDSILSALRPSGVIRERSHGGSNTNFTFASPTPGNSSSLRCT